MAKGSLDMVDCVIGGVQKGGTTYLHRVLDEKIPELCLSQPKETKVFLKDNFFKTPPTQDISMKNIGLFSQRIRLRKYE